MKNLISLLLFLSTALALSANEATKKAKTEADTLAGKGNWKEAAEAYETFIYSEDADPLTVHDSFNKTVMSYQRINNMPKTDEVREKMVEAHPKNWRVLEAVAMNYMQTQHYGVILNGEFKRGHHRGGGAYAQSTERDRVRSAQLYEQALKAAPEGQRGNVALNYADAIAGRRGGFGAWQFQSLTDLTTLPDVEETGGQFPGYGYRGHRGAGHASVDEDGNPVFYEVPESWEAAANDGERWRWLLSQAPQKDAKRRLANWAYGQFGVQTMAAYSWFFHRPNAGKANEDKGNTMALHTLDENETIAKLATGVKRFDLPADYQYIRLHRELGNHSTLGSIFQNRRQFPEAAAAYRKAPRAQRQVDQIVGNWGTIEPTNTKAAGTKPVLDYKFRNGKAVSFTAQKIDMQKAVDDVIKYIETKPERIDWNRQNIGNIGYNIVNGDAAKYLIGQKTEWSEQLTPADKHWDKRVTLEAPLTEPGAYFITAKMKGGNQSRVILWVNDTVIVKKNIADNDKTAMYFVADAATGKPIPNAELNLFGYRQQYVRNPDGRGGKQKVFTKSFSGKTDGDGTLFPSQRDVMDGNQGYQWIVKATKGERFAWFGFSNMWHNRNPQYDGQYQATKTFVMTDRPVYRPDQTVNWKVWKRHAQYDKENESQFAGKGLVVTITNPKNEKVKSYQLTLDEFGGGEGSLELPEDAPLGVYRITGKGFNETFRVEEYKKPEFEVKIEAPSKPIVLGEQVEATIEAKYFFGAPVANGTAKIKVTRNVHRDEWYPEAEWDWFYGPGYWWFAYDYDWWPGWDRWGCMAPHPWWMHRATPPPEVVLEFEAELGPGGIIKVPIDTALAKAMHGDKNHAYNISAEVTDESRRTITGSGRVIAAKEAFKVTVWADRGYARIGDPIWVETAARTPDGKPVQGKGKLVVKRISYDEKTREPVETDIATFELDTNEEGRAKQQLQANEAGQFRLVYTLDDGNGHTIEGGHVMVVRGKTFKADGLRFSPIELVPDKREYQNGEAVQLMINTDQEDSTVLLFTRAANGQYRPPRRLDIDGKSKVVAIPVSKKDMPNFFVEVVTVAKGRVHSEVKEIIVPPEERVLNVDVVPNEERYLPGQSAEVKIKITDGDGNPFQGQAALTVYDKSVEYISGGSNIDDIREFFWKWRRRHNVQTEHNFNRSTANIHLRGETNMGTLGVFGHRVADDQMQMAQQAGFAGGGFRGRVMNSYSAAPGAAMAMDSMAVAESAPMAAAPMMSRMAKSSAGAGAPMANAMMLAEPAVQMPADLVPPNVEAMVRENFADTAFWKGTINTDQNGEAVVTFDMPENLTGWKMKVWGMGHGTKVGQGEVEVVTAKNLLVRLQAPRFFVETDEVVLSANVHNYLEREKQVTTELLLEGGVLESLEPTTTIVTIGAGGEQRVDWRVKVIGEGTASVTMKALTDEESDAMKMEFPAYVHGATVTASVSGHMKPSQRNAKFEITVPAERRPELSKLEVRWSPTLAGAMIDAIPYLVDYPYGCTEQTLSRFVPAVLAQKAVKDMGVDIAALKDKKTNLNAQEIGDSQKRAAQWAKKKNRWGQNHRTINPVFDQEEMDNIVNAGLERITSMQMQDGGWGWFSGRGERSSPHTTAYAVHSLQIAEANGLPLKSGMLDNGIAWMQRHADERVVWIKVNREHRRASNMDAFVFMVLVDAKKKNDALQALLYEDRNGLSVYAKSMMGLATHRLGSLEQRDMYRRNVEQFLKVDDENQTAWLELGNQGYWWSWYGSEIEAHAYYLKLLADIEPDGPIASRMVKYLLNNRKNGTYWNSTRDTAIALEAMSDYLVASNEDRPNYTLDLLVDGEVKKTVKVTPDNIFEIDNSFVLEGEALSSGAHTVSFRKNGTGPVYFNGYTTNFSKEDFIRKQGLEIKVERKMYKLIPEEKSVDVRGARGQAVSQKVEKFTRELVTNDAMLKSGDLVEVELEITSKNDYEYLLFEDFKASGFEPVNVRSGYSRDGGLRSYVEFRDEKVAFFVQNLARGQHNLKYRLRAEIPGRFSALPTQAFGMYAPELRANSDELKVQIED